MSVLFPQPETPAERTAKLLVSHSREIYSRLVSAFNNGAKIFWTNPDVMPHDVAEALGEDAVEIFQLHAKIGALLAQVNPAAIAEGAAVVGEFEYNEDGTVTITDPPPNT